MHNSLWITLPTQSCLVLYSFHSGLQHSLIIWFSISSLSLHNVYLQFFFHFSQSKNFWVFLVRFSSTLYLKESLTTFDGNSLLNYISWVMSPFLKLFNQFWAAQLDIISFLSTSFSDIKVKFKIISQNCKNLNMCICPHPYLKQIVQLNMPLRMFLKRDEFEFKERKAIILNQFYKVWR